MLNNKQLCSGFNPCDKRDAGIEGNTPSKRYQGSSEKIVMGKVKPYKTAVSQKNQFRIKPICDKEQYEKKKGPENRQNFE